MRKGRLDAQRFIPPSEAPSVWTACRAESTRQHDDLRCFDTALEAIMSFDRRVPRLEGRLNAQGAE